MAEHIDLVCGAPLSDKDIIAQSQYLAQTYYFCSEGCKHKFDQRPEDYVIKSQTL